MTQNNNITKSGGGDLHIHTTFSDGLIKPEGVLKEAVRLGFKTISITDHDNIKGYLNALEHVSNYNLEIIPGIELSCSDGEKDYHILGYFIDCTNKKLTETLKMVQENRKKRMRQTIERFISFGININPDKFFQEVNVETVSRLHLANYLTKEKLVPSIHEVFSKYLGDGKPAHIPINALHIKDALELISEIGGISVFAHPGVSKNDGIIPEMINLGLKGIEAYNPSHDNKEISHYLEIADRYNLLITGGSDWHGQKNANKKIGDIRLSNERLNDLKNSV